VAGYPVLRAQFTQLRLLDRAVRQARNGAAGVEAAGGTSPSANAGFGSIALNKNARNKLDKSMRKTQWISSPPRQSGLSFAFSGSRPVVFDFLPVISNHNLGFAILQGRWWNAADKKTRAGLIGEPWFSCLPVYWST